MKSGVMRIVMSAVVVMLVVGASGCKKKPKAGVTGGVGSDTIPLTPLGEIGYGEVAERGEFGEPITDVSFENVAFAYDSFTLASSEHPKIEAVADYLLANEGTTVVVDGHCDERGSRDYNLSLGEHRAMAVRAYMISLGVAEDRINTRSFGAEQPLDAEHNEAAWVKNRRAEFSLFRK
ncbi:MAG TPA: hypothetical protein DCS43_09060 [Verrucomicrobia bacterium]|nr:hypothetical protein [Verrucomicrobiota bacterium]